METVPVALTVSLLDWTLERAHAAEFASVTVACEPTGHRWRVLDQLAAEGDCPDMRAAAAPTYVQAFGVCT